MNSIVFTFEKFCPYDAASVITNMCDYWVMEVAIAHNTFAFKSDIDEASIAKMVDALNEKEHTSFAEWCVEARESCGSVWCCPPSSNLVTHISFNGNVRALPVETLNPGDF
jgi:hypothetical protein